MEHRFRKELAPLFYELETWQKHLEKTKADPRYDPSIDFLQMLEDDVNRWWNDLWESTCKALNWFDAHSQKTTTAACQLEAEIAKCREMIGCYPPGVSDFHRNQGTAAVKLRELDKDTLEVGPSRSAAADAGENVAAEDVGVDVADDWAGTAVDDMETNGAAAQRKGKSSFAPAKHRRVRRHGGSSGGGGSSGRGDGRDGRSGGGRSGGRPAGVKKKRAGRKGGSNKGAQKA